MIPGVPYWLLPCAGALSKQVTDTIVSNQQPAKEGGPTKRKKATSLGVLIEAGVIKDGALLRYMKVAAHLPVPGQCMSTGAAHGGSAPESGSAALHCMGCCCSTPGLASARELMAVMCTQKLGAELHG